MGSADTDRLYMCIDLKCFYASVECADLGLDPFTTPLVVADGSRGKGAITLAISPALKKLGVKNRSRLFQIPPHIEYLTVKPHMKRYMQVSAEIYGTLLKYVAPEDVHVYSIDEYFIDITSYLPLYKKTPRQLAQMLLDAVLAATKIYATVGIGTNLFLAKIALDILAKHAPDFIGYLDESLFKEKIWYHQPLTDIWQIGNGIANRLHKYGAYDLHGITMVPEAKLYKEFGVNAELLIDHAWGYEPCTMEMIKAYKPETNSVCSGQVLHCPYDFEKAKLVVKEMTDQMVLDLVDKKLVTDQIVLTVGYDIENLNNPDRRKKYHGEITIDRYGRRIPKHAHGTTNLKRQTSSTKLITDAVIELYDRIVDRDLLIRRINITANRLVDESSVKKEEVYEQLDLFADYEAQRKKQEEEEAVLDREKRMQEAMLSIKKKFGKNAVLKGMNLQEGATARDRNEQIGGHKA